MKRDYRLLFGPLAGAILALGVAGLGLMIPGYNHVRQTVSEIGEIGSPARVPFAIMLCCVAACILVFAAAVRHRSLQAGHSRLAAYLLGFMALPAAGLGVFAYPHPLHNVFGISELIGYQAPLVFAWTWRRDPRARTLVAVSWLFSVLIWVAILLNLSSLDRQGLLWAYVKPLNGLAQRSLFAGWFGWCAVLGVLLFQHSRSLWARREGVAALAYGAMSSRGAEQAEGVRVRTRGTAWRGGCGAGRESGAGARPEPQSSRAAGRHRAGLGCASVAT